MNLTTVTITGADDAVKHNALLDLTIQYPFVEWGILLSKAKMGQPRYPSLEWMQGLTEMHLPLSGHLCGAWCRDLVLRNRWTVLEDLPESVWSKFIRLQLNTAGQFHKAGGNFVKCLLQHKFGYIFQSGKDHTMMRKAKHHGVYVSPLFDLSGGHGIVPDRWPEPVPDYICGYAGGLSPVNLKQHLQTINDLTGDTEIWIDVESGVRTVNQFNLDLVQEFLAIASKWVSA